MRPDVPVGVSASCASWPARAAACAAASSADSVTSCCVASRLVSCNIQNKLMWILADRLPTVSHKKADACNPHDKWMMPQALEPYRNP